MEKATTRGKRLMLLALPLLTLGAGCGIKTDGAAETGRAETGRAETGRAEAGIRAVLDSQVAAWNRGDLEGYMQGYWKHDSVRFVSGGGVSYGWSAMLERYRRGYPDTASMGRLRFEDVRITLCSDSAASVFGTWRLLRRSDAPWGYFTLLMKRTGAGWRVLHDHTSSAR